MIGDEIILLPEHREKSEIIFNKCKGILSKQKKNVIAIGGEPGTGKSEISRYLSKSLLKSGLYSRILQLDDYYKEKPAIRLENRKLTGIVGLDEIDKGMLATNIIKFRQSEQDYLPCYNKFTNEIEALIVIHNYPVLILEGLYALAFDFDLGVHVNGSYMDEDNIKFRIKRGKEQQTEFRQFVLEKESKIVNTLRVRADFEV